MAIEKLLVSKAEEILKSLPTDEEKSIEVTKRYEESCKEIRKKYKYFSPTYHKEVIKPVYLDSSI